MRKLLPVVFSLVAVPAFAQDLPAPSPKASVTQTVGLTDLTVDYSSPAVKGREIWGKLVPQGEVWRAGANQATKLTISKDVTFGTTHVPAGSYSVFVVPQKTGNWTFILNKDLKANTSTYKKENDVARVDVKPEAIPMRERLGYSFPSFTHVDGVLALEWEKVRVAVPFKTGTDAQVAAIMEDIQDGTWVPANRAARYLLEQKKDYDAGLRFAELSLKQKEYWFNTWTKAQLLAAKGNYKEAYPLAQKAQALGEKTPKEFFFADEVKAAVRDWKAKS